MFRGHLTILEPNGSTTSTISQALTKHDFLTLPVSLRLKHPKGKKSMHVMYVSPQPVSQQENLPNVFGLQVTRSVRRTKHGEAERPPSIFFGSRVFGAGKGLVFAFTIRRWYHVPRAETGTDACSQASSVLDFPAAP